MPNNNHKAFELLEQQYRSFKQKLPEQVATTAVNFFKRNFKLGGFTDQPFRRWEKSDYPGMGKTTMVKSGQTRRDIKKIQVSPNKVVVGIGNHNHYAGIHNTGGKIPITPKMRRFFWAKYLELSGIKKPMSTIERKKREEAIPDCLFWKALALTQKDCIDIPKRQFIGDSKALDVAIERQIIKLLKHYLKQ